MRVSHFPSRTQPVFLYVSAETKLKDGTNTRQKDGETIEQKAEMWRASGCLNSPSSIFRSERLDRFLNSKHNAHKRKQFVGYLPGQSRLEAPLLSCCFPISCPSVCRSSHELGPTLPAAMWTRKQTCYMLDSQTSWTVDGLRLPSKNNGREEKRQMPIEGTKHLTSDNTYLTKSEPKWEHTVTRHSCLVTVNTTIYLIPYTSTLYFSRMAHFWKWFTWTRCPPRYTMPCAFGKWRQFYSKGPNEYELNFYDYQTSFQSFIPDHIKSSSYYLLLISYCL